MSQLTHSMKQHISKRNIIEEPTTSEDEKKERKRRKTTQRAEQRARKKESMTIEELADLKAKQAQQRAIQRAENKTIRKAKTSAERVREFRARQRARRQIQVVFIESCPNTSTETQQNFLTLNATNQQNLIVKDSSNILENNYTMDDFYEKKEIDQELIIEQEPKIFGKNMPGSKYEDTEDEFYVKKEIEEVIIKQESRIFEQNMLDSTIEDFYIKKEMEEIAIKKEMDSFEDNIQDFCRIKEFKIKEETIEDTQNIKCENTKHDFSMKKELDFEGYNTQDMEINNCAQKQLCKTNTHSIIVENQHSFVPEKDVTSKTATSALINTQGIKSENTKNAFPTKKEINEEFIIKEELDFQEYDVNHSKQEQSNKSITYSVIGRNRHEYDPRKDVTNQTVTSIMTCTKPPLMNATSVTIQNKAQLGPIQTGSEVIQKKKKRTVRPKKSEATRRREYRERLSPEERQRSRAAAAVYMREYRVRMKLKKAGDISQHTDTTTVDEKSVTTSTEPVEKI